MRLITPFVLTPTLTAVPASAQDLRLPLYCSGAEPSWEMIVTEDGTSFDYLFSNELSIALETHAETADWPVALTLTGRGDSAI